MLVTGIDEAGYGPVLGPLVVASATFSIPDRHTNPCLWSLLERAVIRQPRPARGNPRLPVCDSKKLYAGPRKLARLERTAAAFLALAGHTAPSVMPLVRRVADSWPDQVRQPPWYVAADLPLPVAASQADIRTQTAALSSTMRTRGIRLAGLRAVILPAVDYNRMVRATKNKAAVLFWATMRLVTQALAEDGSDHTLVIDRQGGRRRYAAALLKSLDLDRLHVAAEDAQASRYTLTHLPHLGEIGFYKSGEEHHFSIALASIIAKYVRELCMGLFNRYWCQQVEGLTATAGYYADGMRFFGQIQPHLRRLGLEPTAVLRLR